jgi:hypothetical protein
MHFTERNRVSDTGAARDSILVGVAPHNEGLRLRILEDQPKGDGGPIKGWLCILDVGDNKHSESLRQLLGRTTDAQEVITIIRAVHPSCVNVVNANILTVEKGDATRKRKAALDEGDDAQ